MKFIVHRKTMHGESKHMVTIIWSEMTTLSLLQLEWINKKSVAAIIPPQKWY